MPSRQHRRLTAQIRLTPEEDSIGDPGDQDDEIDDLLPADLWFVRNAHRDAENV